MGIKGNSSSTNKSLSKLSGTHLRLSELRRHCRHPKPMQDGFVQPTTCTLHGTQTHDLMFWQYNASTIQPLLLALYALFHKNVYVNLKFKGDWAENECDELNEDSGSLMSTQVQFQCS